MQGGIKMKELRDFMLARSGNYIPNQPIILLDKQPMARVHHAGQHVFFYAAVTLVVTRL